MYNNNEKYYLINPKWIIDYKKYYNYDNLCDLLLEINFSNLDECLQDIKNNYVLYSDHTLNFDNKELSDDLSNMNNFNCVVEKIHDISFIGEGIIYSKIFELIKKLYSNKTK